MGEPTRFFPVDGQGLTELRIHGVSGPDPRGFLETAATFRVAGDNLTGFVRRLGADDRGPRDVPSATGRSVEAFSWRGVSSGGASRAGWLLLAPFALLNVAAWMHPAPASPYDKARARVDPWNDPWVRVLHALLRAFGLSLTAMFALACVAAVGVDTRHQWYTVLGRIAPIGVLGVAGFVTGLRYDRTDAPHDVSGPPPAVGSPLETPRFWHAKSSVWRQLLLHLATSALVVVWASELRHVPRWLGLVVLLGLLAAAAVPAWFSMARDIGDVGDLGLPYPTASAAPEHSSVKPKGWRRWTFHAGWVLAIVMLGAVAGSLLHGHVARAKDGPLPDTLHLVSSLRALLLVHAALLVSIGIVVDLLRRRRFENPHHHRLLWHHTVTFVAALAWMLAALMTGAAMLAAARLSTVHEVRVPGFVDLVDAGSLMIAAGAVVAVLLIAVRLARSYLFYDKERLAQRHADWHCRRACAVAAEAHEGYIVLVPLAVAGVGWLIYTTGALLHAWDPVRPQLTWALSGYVLAAIPLAVKRLTKDAQLRRSVGILWDVTTFWPRAVHPLGPPCYAERVIPQLVERHRALRGMTGAKEGRVLLSGHSQGAVISAALLFQLTAEERKRTALVTYGCQYSYLFARAFPAYLGGHSLDRLAQLLGGPEHPRWLNLYRYTDHLGMQVALSTDYDDHNREVADPPCARATPIPGKPDIRLALQRQGPDLFGDKPTDLSPQTHSNYPASYEYAQAVTQLEATL